MSYKDKAQYIGKKATVSFGELSVEVEILDYKNSYGKDRWLVKPVVGEGEAWVEKLDI